MINKKIKINPGLLKLDLMLKGVRLNETFRQEQGVLVDYLLGPNVFGNGDLILPGGVYVSVPYQEPFVSESPYGIQYIKNKICLTTSEGYLPIRWIPQLRCYDEPVRARVKLSQVACVHGDYVSLAIGGHRYLQPTLLDEDASSYRPELVVSVDETLNLIDLIRKERPIGVISLSAWDPQTEDGGIFQIEPYIRAIKRNYNVLLFVEVQLPKKTNVIDATYAMGADSVCYHIGNLCSHGKSQADPQLDKNFVVRMLEHAVSDYPQGSILAHVTIGPIGERSNEHSKNDIAALCRLKVLPILTIENLHEAHEMCVTAAQLAELHAFTYRRARENKIKMNWFFKLSPFVAPMEGRFFVGDIPRFKLALMNFYQSRILGSSVSAGLSNLRRKLRVKEVSGGTSEHD